MGRRARRVGRQTVAQRLVARRRTQNLRNRSGRTLRGGSGSSRG